MMCNEIPDRFSVSSPPYTGVYQKRRGSRRDPTLYCWFNIEDGDDEDDVFPHVSLHIDGNNLLDELHVTFQVVSSGGFSGEMEKRRYAIYYKVNGLLVTRHDVKTTLGPRSQALLERSGRIPAERQSGSEDMDLYKRTADTFAEAFVHAASAGKRLDPPRPIDKGGLLSSPYQDILGAPHRRL